MSVTGQKYDTKSGVRKITLTSGPQLNPLSNTNSASQNYYCLGFDGSGFQYQIDLQALPAGVVLDQIQQNQVWWVEKRTTLYRLYLYAGLFDSNTRQIDSTYPLPSPVTSSLNNVTVSGNLVVNGIDISNLIIAEAPPGVMMDFAGLKAPEGFLLCDGSSYSTTTYANLFAAIGYAWGGSGTSFNVPDMRGRVSIGAGSGTGLTNRTLAAVSGEENHILLTTEIPSHTHVVTYSGYSGNTGTTSASFSLSTSAGSTGTGTTGTGNTGSTAANIQDPGHTHGGPGGNNYMVRNTAGAFLTGTTTANMSQASNTASATTSITDTGHAHSLAGVTFSIGALTVNAASVPGLSIPALTIPAMAVTGSVAIPGLSFTVAAQTGLTTSGNTATTATGHNNMQPYAVVTKIIKY